MKNEVIAIDVDFERVTRPREANSAAVAIQQPQRARKAESRSCYELTQ